jgi:hypothetical protein
MHGGSNNHQHLHTMLARKALVLEGTCTQVTRTTIMGDYPPAPLVSLLMQTPEIQAHNYPHRCRHRCLSKSKPLTRLPTANSTGDRLAQHQQGTLNCWNKAQPSATPQCKALQADPESEQNATHIQQQHRKPMAVN